jgi:Lar family restriction alleviation protein
MDTPMTHDLYACPFCGGEASMSTGKIGPARAIADYVECLTCAASSDMFFSKEQAIEAWNKRTLPEGVTGYIKIHPEVLAAWNEPLE